MEAENQKNMFNVKLEKVVIRRPFQIQKNSSPSKRIFRSTTTSGTEGTSNAVSENVYSKLLCFYSNIVETSIFLPIFFGL